MSGCHDPNLYRSRWFEAPVEPITRRDLDPMLKDAHPRLARALGYPFEAMQVLFVSPSHPDLDGDYPAQIFRSDEGYFATRMVLQGANEAIQHMKDNILMRFGRDIRAALISGRRRRASVQFQEVTFTSGLDEILRETGMTLYEASRKIRFLIYGKEPEGSMSIAALQNYVRDRTRACKLVEHQNNRFNDKMQRFFYQADVGLGVIR